MIRSQQAQLQQLQQQNQQLNPQSATAVVDDTTPSSERSASFFPPITPPAASSNRLSISSLSNRRSSRPPSQADSPNLQPQDFSRTSDSTEAFSASREGRSRRGSRDESAYYQAEAAMLSRENQMLRQRIRELGKSHHPNLIPRRSCRSSLERGPFRSENRYVSTCSNFTQNARLET